MTAEFPDLPPLTSLDDSAAFPPSPPASRGNDKMPISVTELNRRTRNLIEAKFELLWVAGELSNVTRAASGHWYFVLKDDEAQVRCVMFRNRASVLAFKPENGLQVDVRALPSLYETRGEFQLGVEGMRRAGLGALFEAYERLKAKLSDEGLFDQSRKRPLPSFPRTVGIVTSLQAAALRDVLSTLKRRAPMIVAILYPTAVQGATAAQDIATAIDAARGRREVDALIVCRGGGSIEDLWSFNAEIVARAIARFQDETTIPVISGVGHETDFTICDFVADWRAATPTAAAEMISPDVEQLRGAVQSVRSLLARALRRTLDDAYQRMDQAQRGLLSPQDHLVLARAHLLQCTSNLRYALAARVDRAIFETALLKQRLSSVRPDLALRRASLLQRRAELAQSFQHIQLGRTVSLRRVAQALQLLAPQRVLERGYSIVEHNGRIVRDCADVHIGDTIAIRLARGRLAAEVKSTENATKLASGDREA